jgi:hypothetical protein
MTAPWDLHTKTGRCVRRLGTVGTVEIEVVHSSGAYRADKWAAIGGLQTSGFFLLIGVLGQKKGAAIWLGDSGCERPMGAWHGHRQRGVGDSSGI